MSGYVTAPRDSTGEQSFLRCTILVVSFVTQGGVQLRFGGLRPRVPSYHAFSSHLYARALQLIDALACKSSLSVDVDFPTLRCTVCCLSHWGILD